MKKMTVWVVAISLALASCGRSSAPTTTIEVTMTDFQFSPSAFTVPAGEQITLKSTNSGAVIHNFIIMNLGYNVGNEFDEEDLENVYWKLEIAPGGGTETNFTAPAEPGEYEIVCSTPGHVQAGMLGTLNVVEAE
ncbi:MAG TPA: cupredoxin domain-containing protein [Anaerolineales bacterium]|nr:cupredoxin domain-containing protein [Anaerolineales bacterium]